MNKFEPPVTAGYRRVHIIGIGGVMMSAIARLLYRRGCVVSGSDRQESDNTRALNGEGIAVTIGHHAANLTPDIELVAISAAIPDDNSELVEARRRGIPVRSRAEVLGQVVNHQRGICIAGTHGKTTTSSLAAVILTEAGLDPTFLIGGELTNYHTNSRIGRSDLAVVEADEYSRALLSLEPYVAVVLNVEFDHPDIYADLDDLLGTFRQFVSQTKPGGKVLLCADCRSARSLRDASMTEVQTFGHANYAEWRILPVGSDSGPFEVATPSGVTVTINPPNVGRHYRLNATAAVAACASVGVPVEKAAELVSRSRGTRRRFELLCEVGGIRVVDDYAHHPTEVKATVQAAKALGGRLRVIYEPHQFARNRALVNDYAGVFEGADEAFVVPIYAAREDDLSGVSHELIAEAAGARNVTALESQEAAFDLLTSSAGEHETWLLMGAGTITSLAHRLAEWVAEQRG